jgi:hypothetical protein
MQKELAAAVQSGDAGVFGELGLELSELQSMAPDEQFRRMGQAIGGLSDPAEKTAAAMRIFGRSGGEMLSLFNNAGLFGQAAEEVGSQAEIMNRNAALFGDITDRMAVVGLKVQGFFVGVADSVAPVIEPLMRWFASQDLAAQGQAFGMAIATGITMLTDGTVGRTLLLMAQNAGMAFNNLIVSGIEAAMDLVAKIPGLGGVGDIELPKMDRTGVEAEIAGNVTAAMNRVMDLRDAADRKAAKDKEEGTDGTEGTDGAAGAGSKLKVDRMFATNMGLFVKDAMVSEQRRSNELLGKIDRGIASLKAAAAGPAGGGALRFS